jgi:hypothetical protein
VSLGDASILHSNVGSTGAAAPGSSFTVALAGAETTDGGGTTTVVIVVGIQGSGASTMGTPTGFTLLDKTTSGSIWSWRKPAVAAGESSWSVPVSAGTVISAWWVAEIADFDLDDPLDASAKSIANTDPQTTGTTALNFATDIVCIAAHASVVTTTGTAGTWASQTNGFVENGEAQTSRGVAAPNVDLAVALLFPGDSGTFECSATITPGTDVDVSSGLILVLASATSPSTASVVAMDGFEYGVANPGAVHTVAAGSAIDGSYGARLVAAGAPAARSQGVSATENAVRQAFWLRIVSATGTPIMAEIQCTGGTPLQLVYEVSSSRLGLRWGSGGTAAWQAGTTPTGTAVHVELAASGYKGGTRKAEWFLDELQQDPPADLTEATHNLSSVNIGQDAGTPTYTIDFDNPRLAYTRLGNKLGIQRIMLLPVDPTVLPSVSGTTANFNTFTNNGTMAAWNATAARDAVDEVPPTLGASADGVAQITAAAGDFVEFPLTRYQLAPDEQLLAVHVRVYGWAASATANTVAVRAWNGTTETVIFALADPGWDNTATVFLKSALLPVPAGGWQQSHLDALAVRFGYSDDATPDVGVHAVYAEILIGQQLTESGMQMMGSYG